MKEYQVATEYIVSPEENINFPENVLTAIGKLKKVKEISSSTDIFQCPECGTYYFYRASYEYLVSGSGSYDEYVLTREDDEIVKKYLQDD
ncbi:MAG TPA: hypothetical protein PLG52_01280 [Anaerolineales bacterium]|nr:hypothetical protein [Anaerolineales bacterium]